MDLIRFCQFECVPELAAAGAACRWVTLEEIRRVSTPSGNGQLPAIPVRAGERNRSAWSCNLGNENNHVLVGSVYLVVCLLL